MHFVRARFSRILAAAGHDDGAVRLWDVRAPARASAAAAAQTFSHQADFVSSLTHAPGRHALLATAGDGTLAVYDVRKPGKAKLKALSEADEDERQCAAVVKGGAKVVSGTVGGVLELWSWDHFADCSDRRVC